MGRNGELRKSIQRAIPVRIVDRGTKVVVLGEAEDTVRVGAVLDELLTAIRKGHTPSSDDLNYALRQTGQPAGDGAKDLGSLWSDSPQALRRDIPSKPRTRGQKELLDAIRRFEVVIVTGPAGTGKTFLAMAAALPARLDQVVNRSALRRRRWKASFFSAASSSSSPCASLSPMRSASPPSPRGSGDMR